MNSRSLSWLLRSLAWWPGLLPEPAWREWADQWAKSGGHNAGDHVIGRHVDTCYYAHRLSRPRLRRRPAANPNAGSNSSNVFRSLEQSLFRGLANTPNP